MKMCLYFMVCWIAIFLRCVHKVNRNGVCSFPHLNETRKIYNAIKLFPQSLSDDLMNNSINIAE